MPSNKFEAWRGLCVAGKRILKMHFSNTIRTFFGPADWRVLMIVWWGMTCRVTDEMNADLLKPCTLEEVSLAFKFMGPFKASGPDGFSASFYQHNWAHIGEEVCLAINNFIISGHMDEDINTTNIVLIPKKSHPISVTDFLPFSLCNVIYKIISKVLANRLKAVLPQIISANQRAFIPGRLISDIF
jgi:hypothetical protein